MEQAIVSAETECAQTEDARARVCLMLSCAEEALEIASAAEDAEDLSRAKSVAAFAADCATMSLELARRHAARTAYSATRALLLCDPSDDVSRAVCARASARAAFSCAAEQTKQARGLALRAYFVNLAGDAQPQQ
jgi:hypothetical protein